MPCGCGTESLCIWEPLERKLNGWYVLVWKQIQTVRLYSDDLLDAEALNR